MTHKLKERDKNTGIAESNSTRKAKV